MPLNTFIIHLIPLLKVLFINVRIYLIRMLRLSLIISLKSGLLTLHLITI